MRLYNLDSISSLVSKKETFSILLFGLREIKLKNLTKPNVRKNDII